MSKKREDIWHSEYESLRRKSNLKIRYLQYEIQQLQVSINKTIKQFFDFLELNNIQASEFIKYSKEHKDET